MEVQEEFQPGTLVQRRLSFLESRLRIGIVVRRSKIRTCGKQDDEPHYRVWWAGRAFSPSHGWFHSELEAV